MPTKRNKKEPNNHFSSLLSPDTIKLLSAGGLDLVKEISIDVVRGVVLNVLCGENLRDATEILTRRRISALNLAMVNFFLQGGAKSEDFIEQIPYIAAQNLSTSSLSAAERRLSLWALGLTEKAFQNVLRSTSGRITNYRDQYIQTCYTIMESYIQKYGEITGFIELTSGEKAKVNWLLLTYLLNMVGAETLTIRGSEKSVYGKLFGKLVLGSLLHILGFEYVTEGEFRNQRSVFWITSKDEKRESDATVIFEPGRAVRFDIGFIGRGNTEISLDKTSRFERMLELNDEHWYVKTFIIVDAIGRRSKIVEQAKAIDGTIVQMSGAYWPQKVVSELNQTMGFKHPLLGMEQYQIKEFLTRSMTDVPLERFIGIALAAAEAEVNDDSLE